MAGFFTQELIAEAAILAILALSLDLVASAGLVSFGHAGLLGVGCYVFAGLTVLASGSPNLAFPAAIVAGGLVAFLVGLFAVRTAGAFFIMVTLATAEMLYAWGFRSKAFNGADGMGGVPRARPDRDRDRSQRSIDICARRDRHLRRHLAAA